MSNVQDLKEVEINIDEAKKAIAKRDAVQRLRKNADFNLIFDDGYFVEEASRLVLLKAAAAMQDENHQKQINNSLTGIGYCYQYLGVQLQIGEQAARALNADRETRDELLDEAV